MINYKHVIARIQTSKLMTKSKPPDWMTKSKPPDCTCEIKTYISNLVVGSYIIRVPTS